MIAAPFALRLVTTRLAIVVPMLGVLASGVQAEAITVRYTMAMAGLPIGSAIMVLSPDGASTAVTISGKAGGPLEIGRMSASAVIGAGQVTAQSQSGSGKDASTASLVSRGNPGNSVFSYAGSNSRGPGKIAMTLAAGRATTLDVAIPDSIQAVRVPVTDAHKTGVVDPLSVLAQVIQPGGTMKPENLCGKSYGIFTGQSRFNLTGSALQEQAAIKGMPEGYKALSCKVTVTPVSGHRIDKGNAAQARTSTVVFASSASAARVVLWSVAVPGTFGTFGLTANSIQ
jgi:hypothetical protein